MFAESLGLDPDEVLSKDAIAKPHRTTVANREHLRKEVLNQAPKEAILKELKTSI